MGDINWSHLFYRTKDRLSDALGYKSFTSLEQKIRSNLKSPIKSLEEFARLTSDILDYLSIGDIQFEPANSNKYEEYSFFKKNEIASSVASRPVNRNKFIQNSDEFMEKFLSMSLEPPYEDVEEVFYTMAITLGVALDLVVKPQTARKNVGNRLEEFYSSILNELEVTHSTEVQPLGKSRIDIVMSPHSEVKSCKDEVDPSEVFFSVKYSSKDRMKTIFSDKEDLEEACGEDVDMIAAFVHDIQRRGDNGIAKTFVPNVFKTKNTNSPLSGVYYIDKPKPGRDESVNDKLKQFIDLVRSKALSKCA